MKNQKFFLNFTSHFSLNFLLPQYSMKNQNTDPLLHLTVQITCVINVHINNTTKKTVLAKKPTFKMLGLSFT